MVDAVHNALFYTGGPKALPPELASRVKKTSSGTPRRRVQADAGSGGGRRTSSLRESRAGAGSRDARDAGDAHHPEPASGGRPPSRLAGGGAPRAGSVPDGQSRHRARDLQATSSGAGSDPFGSKIEELSNYALHQRQGPPSGRGAPQGRPPSGRGADPQPPLTSGRDSRAGYTASTPRSAREASAPRETAENAVDVDLPLWDVGHTKAGDREGESSPVPARPTTPCMNRGSDGSRRRRTNSAGASGRRSRSGVAASQHDPGSVSARISELEYALLAGMGNGERSEAPEAYDRAPRPVSCSGRESVLGHAAPTGPLGDEPPDMVAPAWAPRSRPSSSGRASVLGKAPRPSSSSRRGGGGHGHGINAPVSLIEEAMAMCQNARAYAPASGTSAADSDASPSRHGERPKAPTPEQTNHWLQGMDQSQAEVPFREDSKSRLGRPVAREDQAVSSRSSSAESYRRDRPRSPTPTKMLAWEEDQETGGEHDEGRGDHTDGLIAKLISACQMNDVNKAFTFFDKLRKMNVPLYEGVYKLLIECCMRTQQLGHAMQFYETLKGTFKGTGQRVSARLVMLLMEACAKEQHGDKVYAMWTEWCPANAAVTAAHGEVLLVAASALIRTMSPDLARSILEDASQRAAGPGGLAACLADSEVELEELVQLNETVMDEAVANGTLLEGLAGQFNELHRMLGELHQKCLQTLSGRPRADRSQGQDLLMEDLDLDMDLELAAM